MKAMIDNMLRRLDEWELARLKPMVEELADDVAMLDETTRQRLEDFDREATLLRDHFKARLQIDAIEAKRRLAAKQHRVGVLERALMKESRA